MRKFTACVLSAGILMLTGLSDVEGLFGKKDSKTDSVSFSIFGGDTSNLITAANNLKTGLTDGKKSHKRCYYRYEEANNRYQNF